MEFRILGPLEVLADGRQQAIPAGHQRTLLALFLVNPNRVLPPDRIADAVWGDDLPATGTKALAYHVSRLRDALAPERHRGDAAGGLETEPGGYVLRVDSDAIDAVRFERLVRRAHEQLPDDPAAARGTLAEAFDLWRGDPLVDVAYAEFAQAEIRRLAEIRLGALEDRLEADLALGRHAEVVAELEDLLRTDPLRERLRGELMLALYRCGRQAEALRVAGEGRRLLAEELGIDPSPELAVLEARILAQDPGLTPAPLAAAPARARNPYKGLRAFGEADSADFFGREALVGRLLARLEEVASDGRLLVVVGPSGSGKSSVVRAGLVPALRAGAVDGSGRWLIATMVPGTAPFRELAAGLRAAGVDVADDAGERAGETSSLATLVEAALAGGAPRLLLVVDQLEELYLGVDGPTRDRFLAALVAELGEPAGRFVCVATLRADFFHRPLLSPDLGELVRRGVEVVTPLTRPELERAVVRPAASVGVAVEPGLVAEIVADVERQPGSLPLLQYALTDLFERSDGRSLTRDGYAATGGAMATLGRRADEAWQSLGVADRETARQVLLRLVVLAEDAEDTARRAPRTELLSLADDPGRVDGVLDELGRRRLLTFDRDAVTSDPTVEIAHEALLRHWHRLALWIEDRRHDLWMRRRLGDAAAEWEAAGRTTPYLLAGGRLDQLAHWAETGALRLSDAERAYLDASLEERRRLGRRARIARIGTAGVLAAGVVAAVALSVALLGERRAAEEQADVTAARELALGSVASLRTDPQLALLLALEAANATEDRGYVVEEAYDALHWALQEAPVALPSGAWPTAVREGPDGPRGIALLPPDELMRLAATHARRPLSADECRTYLRAVACDPVDPPPLEAPPLAVRTGVGAVPAVSLAVDSLAGTPVRVLSELPADVSLVLDPLEIEAGVEVAWDPAAGGDLAGRLEAGDPPDVAIVARPSLVAAVAAGGRLLDVARLVDTTALVADAGPYAAGLGSVGADGTWPAPGAGALYGAPFAASVDDLLWYPAAAFAAAGYVPPATYAELDALVNRILADGREPWCLGMDNGGLPWTAATAWIEDLLLDRAGRDAYDRWTAGALRFDSPEVSAAFEGLGSYVLRAGAVHGGIASAARTPMAMAALPMLLEEPQCWLYRGSSADRATFRGAAAAGAAAVPFPAGATGSHPVLARLYQVVVLRDRPEVRRVVEALLARESAAVLATELAPAGLFPIRDVTPAGDGLARDQANRLRHGLERGTFRAHAADLFPPPVAAAFRGAVAAYLDPAPPGLPDVLWGPDDVWLALRESEAE